MLSENRFRLAGVVEIDHEYNFFFFKELEGAIQDGANTTLGQDGIS